VTQQQPDSSSADASRPTSSGSGVNEQLAITLARELADSRCSDVLVLDTRGLTDMHDYVVIASGTSERQIRAVSHQVKHAVEAAGQAVYRVSADSDARWIIVDCVDIVVNLFEPNQRSFYDLESRWGDAPEIAWQRPGDAPKPGVTASAEPVAAAPIAPVQVAPQTRSDVVTPPDATPTVKAAKTSAKKVSGKPVAKTAKATAKKKIAKPAAKKAPAKSAKKVAKAGAKKVAPKAAKKTAKAASKKVAKKATKKAAKKAAKKSAK
jgi:ribosome-associated protein